MTTPTLGYCLNVHPGETLDELCAVLRGPVARARRALGEGPIDVGLWLPGPVAAVLANDAAARERYAAALAEAGARPFTANAFPIGGFHGKTVKREVYVPTWTKGERLRYTIEVAAALSHLLPPGAEASISTVPVSYRAFEESVALLDLAGEVIGSAALAFERIAERTGRSFVLALEPEPLATLACAADAVTFLEAAVFGGRGRGVIARSLGVTPEEAETIVRARVGVCLDACHHAVVFEDVEAALATYARAGVRVAKAQLSSALALERPRERPSAVARLRGFDEPRYLHQTFALDSRGALASTEDLGRAFDGDTLREPFAGADELRCHFHVPLVWPGAGGLSSTRGLLERALPAIAQATRCLEVETYTFDVLPEDERAAFGGDVARMVAAELAWARAALAR